MTANDGNPPSRSPADNDSATGVFNLVLQKFLQQTDDMLPAKVIAYDRTTNTVNVQPMITMVTTLNQRLSRSQISAIPVLQIGGGNFVLTFPLAPGDFGWIKANDRDISLFLQSMQESPPNTFRMHSFEDALFIPDKMRNWTLNSEDANNAVLQSIDGSVRVAIWSDKVKISAPELLVDCPVMTVTGILNVQNSGSSSTPCTINGNITTNADVIASGISLVTHVHSGVTTGGGDTGAPV